MSARINALRLPAITAVLLLPSGGSPGAEPERCVPAVASYADVLERVSPAIVSVYTKSTTDLYLAPASRSKSEENELVSFGSGVLVDPAGLVATSSHGLRADSSVKVTLADKREFNAEIVLMDQRTDLAVLRLRGAEGLATVEIGDSDKVRAGDFVLAIGNPYGVGQTVTHGLVSAVGRTHLELSEYEYYIQTDAAMNPGSSGGALLDSRGLLIGINTAIVTQTRGWQGIGFAAPANMLSFVLAAARKGEKLIRRPWLGVKLTSLDASSAARSGLKQHLGAVLKEVFADSPAARAGLQPGDILTSIDGRAIEDPSAFLYRFTMKGIYERARLGVLRGGTEVVVEVAPGPAPEQPSRESTEMRTLSILQGATIANLSPAVAEELGLDPEAVGVVVVEVEKDTMAQKFGFLRGDILLTANGVKIDSVRDAVRLLQNRRTTTLELDRGGDIFSTRITRKPTRR